MGSISHPGHVSVRADQQDRGSRNYAEDRKLPGTTVFDVKRPDPVCPWRDVDARLSEIEQHRSGIVQQREGADWTFRRNEIEIGYAPSKQRMSLAEIIMNI